MRVHKRELLSSLHLISRMISHNKSVSLPTPRSTAALDGARETIRPASLHGHRLGPRLERAGLGVGLGGLVGELAAAGVDVDAAAHAHGAGQPVLGQFGDEGLGRRHARRPAAEAARCPDAGSVHVVSGSGRAGARLLAEGSSGSSGYSG